MRIETGLPVPIFNVLKYFFFIVFIETVARNALNNVYLFLRKFDLYKGNGTALCSSRIDRYNLLQMTRSRSILRVVFWTLLVTCFYAVEILFEFSLDASSQRSMRSERMLVYNASYSACGSFNWLPTAVAYDMSTMAKSCVDLTEKEYILYRPTWIREESSQQSQRSFCAKVPRNELRRGKLIYEDRCFTEGSPSWDAVADILAALRTNASSSNDYQKTSLITISVSSQHIFLSENLQFSANRSTAENSYRTALLNVVFPSKTSFVLCGGLIYGAVGEGIFKIIMYSCLENSSSGLHYMQVSGTASVFLDVEFMETEQWTVDVATYFGIAIRNFTRGVLSSNHNKDFVQTVIYASMLSAVYGKDSDSLNQYAAIFKHCDLLKVAQPWDRAEWQEVQDVNLEKEFTVLFSRWGLVPVICWTITLWVTARFLLRFADRKEMPDSIEGEISIAQRWATREDDKRDQLFTSAQHESSRRWIHRFTCSPSAQAYLNVAAGSDFDDIVASRAPIQISRDTSKPFKKVH